MIVDNTQEDRPQGESAESGSATAMPVEQELAPVTNIRPTVGDELRMHREQAGDSIASLAEAVRIQKRYLSALEEGRIDELPGTVYALGFLRTYAEHYGLNGDAFVTRFKEETDGQRHEQDYTMPEPIEEARVPTAAIIVLGVVLAIGAYAGWYHFRTEPGQVADAVPDVPARLETAPAQTQTAESAPQPATASTTQAAPAPDLTTAPVPAPAVPAPAVSAPAIPAPAIPAPSQSSTQGTAAQQPQQQQASEPMPPVDTAPAPVPVETAALPNPAPEPTPAAPAASSSTADNVAAAPGGTDAPAAPAVEEPAHVPQTFGASNTDARIVITATDDSWIEITDANGNRLLSRTLRAGDKYRVPNRDGLVFVTGNAGGLDISVDGAHVPSIGDTGIVRKNVKLDPELLKQGRAWP